MPYTKKGASEWEARAYAIFNGAGAPVPAVQDFDAAEGVLVLDDLSEACRAFRDGDAAYAVDALAELHLLFWDNYDVFGEVGVPWRLDTEKNLDRHCKAMAEHLRFYLKKHKDEPAEVYERAHRYFIENMRRAVKERLHMGLDITVLHGDCHPGNVLIADGEPDRVMFVDLEGARMGLGAEDLAMLLGLHLAPEREQALPLLERYHTRVAAQRPGFAFETLLRDYRLALSEALFFPLKLFAERSIDDAQMLANAKAACASFGVIR